jgi:hypothetical protein
MNKKIHFPIDKLTVMLLLVGVLLGYAPKSLAQTVQEWSNPINLSMSGAATNPIMVVDGNGVIHVTWSDIFDGYKYTQSTDGVTWTPAVTVKFPFSPTAPPPVMFSDAQGVIHIFWLDDKNKLSYAQTLPNNLGNPASWRVKTDLDTTVYDFDAGVDLDGKVHVVYLKNPTLKSDTANPTSASKPGKAGVFYKGSSNGGTTWSAGTLLYESPYLRSLSADNAHIRMAVSDKATENQVYAVWDDRTQKRVFIAISNDGGLSWGEAKEMIAPQANLGYQTPYNADIDVLNDKVLATWFVGDPGSQCVPYSWSSADRGETWGEQIPIVPDTAQCPEKSAFISADPAYSVDMFTVQGNLFLSAWNGTNWSNWEAETGPASITNPATFEPVTLGCQQVAPYKNQLLVVGCDKGNGGDIWFVERKLDSLEYLFPLPNQWGGDTNILSTPREISSLASIADDSGNVHAVWVQSPNAPTDVSVPVIQYSSWNGSEWTKPSPIFSNLDGPPSNLSMQIDDQKRLLLAWVNQNTGEMMFTWANAMRANVPQEWLQPLVVVAPSKLTNSPDMLVDAANRIVIAYAVTLNEDRGIYIIQSTDLGKSWSAPVKIFDAAAAGWEMVDQPKLAVTEDGTMHILFTRYELMGGPQPSGLYYSQSSDGGLTWTPAETVSEQPVQWSKLIAYQGTLHRLWQEKNRLSAQTNHQVSSDAGKTWEAVNKIPSDADLNSHPDVSIDGTGTLHFTQVKGQDEQNFEEWEWMQGNWQLVESRKVGGTQLNSAPIVDSGITFGGKVYAVLQLTKLVNDKKETDIWSINRSIDTNKTAGASLATISTPSAATVAQPIQDQQPTPISTSPLANFNDPQPKVSRNVIGLVLIIVIVFFILIFMLPRRGNSKGNVRK